MLDPFMGSGTTAVAALRTSPALHRLRHRPLLHQPERKHASPRRRERLRQPDDARRYAVPCQPPRHTFRPTTPSTSRRAPSAKEGRRRTSPDLLLESCDFVDIRADVKFSAAGDRAQLPRRRPDGPRMGLRRVRRILLQPGRTAAHRHAVEGARQGSRAPSGPQGSPPHPSHHRRPDPRQRRLGRPGGAPPAPAGPSSTSWNCSDTRTMSGCANMPSRAAPASTEHR